MSTPPPPAGYESAAELQAEHARLLAEVEAALDDDATEAAERQALQALRPRIETFLARGAATGVFLEPVRERTACQVLLDYWSQRLAEPGTAAPVVRLARFDGERLPTLAGRACPYVGLESFRSEAYFFGREEDTRQLVALIRATPLVVVLGASGSGKSSLVMAGALPVLSAEAGAWRTLPVWVPGDAPWLHFAQSLAAALARQDAAALPGQDEAALAAALRGDPARLPSLLAEGPPALLTIDQFEEIFTLAAAEEREPLAQALAALLDAGRGHRVVLTVREEFRSRIVELRALERWLDASWFQIRPLGYEQLRAAVERPAALANLQFQPGISDDLVKKVLGQPAALPLLQFTLRALWDARDRNRITQDVYRRVGDPLQALQAAADAFYFAQLPEARDEIKRVLLELVRVDELLETYRQPVHRQQLLAPGRSNTEEVLRLLAAQDFVRISDGGELVEVKHEALVRNWPLLVGWIDEKRLQRRQRLALMQAAQRWAASGRPDEGLLTGWQLQEAERQQIELNELERDFVAASAAAIARAGDAREQALAAEAARERRLKMLGWGLLGIASTATVVLALWAAWLFERLEQTERLKDDVEANLSQGREEFTRREHELQATQEQLQTALERVTRERDELFALQLKNAVASAARTPAAAGPGMDPGAGAWSSQLVEIYFHISEASQRARAEQIAKQISGPGIRSYGAELVATAPQRSQVRYFRPEDRAGAEEVQRLLADYLGGAAIDLVHVRGHAAAVPMRRYEVWFAPGALTTAKMQTYQR